MPSGPSIHLYAIADIGSLQSRNVALRDFAESLRAAGVGLVQLRDKTGSPREVLASAEILREVFAGTGCRLILNDRADLAVLAGFDGVHVGQGDLSVEDARVVVGPDRWVGVSTHNAEQVRVADGTSADYIAIGPVFATGTKLDADPVVGLDGITSARKLTSRLLVSIGGISRSNCGSVRDSGSGSVAVISGLFAQGETVERVARDFLDILR
jgi:thiamine-phosphate pyrophosphorylase